MVTSSDVIGIANTAINLGVILGVTKLTFDFAENITKPYRPKKGKRKKQSYDDSWDFDYNFDFNY